MKAEERSALLLLAKSEDPYMRVLAQLADLRMRKSADYDEHGVQLKDYFPFGFISYVQMIWVKTLRLRSLVNEDAKNESVDDSLRDLCNYAIFALMRKP